MSAGALPPLPPLPLVRRLRGAAGIAGPLLHLRGTPGAALGEQVEITQPGQPPRRGQVIDAGVEASVVQVLEDTLGVAPSLADVVFAGGPGTVVVGRELIGRAFDGLGRPRDGLPPPVGEALAPLAGRAMNPARRRPPADFVETGISAIDGLNTLVRGQKLPIFSGPGLPALDLAAQIVTDARAPRGEQFAVVFVAMGITHRECQLFLSRCAGSGAGNRTVLYLNETSDPAIERLLAPRVALAAAEFLAFEAGLHVLLVMADITHYAEALREISTAREEIPGRRGYPGYLYTDLASLFERAGILAGRPGSLTQVPVLTMPDDDITHPIPDLTGYITEGQVVLSRELHRQGIYPPIDILPSLSRLMKAGIGEGRTEAWHRRWSDQIYASYARGREARAMASIVGETGLTDEDRRALAFAERCERELIGQGGGRRTLAETFAVGWRLLAALPRADLHRLDAAAWSACERAANEAGAEVGVDA